MSLTPEEQRFFETGDASHLQAGAPAPSPAPEPPALNPVDLQALATATAPAPPAPPAAPVPPPPAAPAPAPAPAEDPKLEILRQSLAETQRQLAEAIAAQKAAQPPEKQEEPPDPNDPLAVLMHKINTIAESVKTLQEQTVKQASQSAEVQRFQAFKGHVQALADEFSKTHPDFNAARDYLRANRVADLQAYGMTTQQIQETIFREEVALSESAIRQAKNPAQVLYESAQRHGYKQAAAPAPAPAPAPSAGPTAEAIQRAQAAARQLPAQPSAGEVELTEQGLRQASEADLNRMVLDDAAWKRLTQQDQYPL